MKDKCKIKSRSDKCQLHAIVNDMCNLSEGIWQRGIRQGIQQGERLSVIRVIRNNV